MNPAAIRTSARHLPADLFGLGETARAALEGGPAFGPIPVARTINDIPRPAEFLGSEEREALAQSIARGTSIAGLELKGEARRSLDALAEVGTSCVITGQQPGFLAAPLYSLYKALQACRAARELTSRLGAPVIPIFWNHADDHDVAEVHHAWQLNRNLDLQKVSLAGLSSGRAPVGEIVIDAEAQSLGALRAQLRGVVEEHAGADAALDLFLPRDGETLARSFSRILSELCGRFGLVVCEPDWIRTQLSSELGRIISGGALDALRAGSESLCALGLEPAIAIDGPDGTAGAALVFRHEGEPRAERVALRAGGDGYRKDGEPGSRTAAELGSAIVTAPEQYSAGALLRPLVQDAVFPTCAYVGGYGELAYHAQLGPARDAAGVARTPFLPRASMTLVDDETVYALERVEAELDDVLRAGGEYKPDERDPEEPAVVHALREVGERTKAALLEHKTAIADLEPALAITLKKTAGHVEQSIGKVIDKAMRVHKNSTGKGARQLRRVNNVLVPRGEPQERVLGPFQFYARFGEAFIAALEREVPAAATEHIAVQLHSKDD